MAKNENTHGGAGRNQGRTAPDADGEFYPIKVNLDRTTMTKARAIGNGMVSMGIRLAINASCRARRHNEQMLCGSCGLSWNIDDKDPPKCDLENVLIPKKRPPSPFGRQRGPNKPKV